MAAVKWMIELNDSDTPLFLELFKKYNVKVESKPTFALMEASLPKGERKAWLRIKASIQAGMAEAKNKESGLTWEELKEQMNYGDNISEAIR